jgi:hypothetical protein
MGRAGSSKHPPTSIASVGDRDPAHCFSDYLNCWINFAATPELTGRAFLAETHPIIVRLMHVPILPVYRFDRRSGHLSRNVPKDRDRGENKSGSKRTHQSGDDKTRIHYALQIHNFESPITVGSPRRGNPLSLAP